MARELISSRPADLSLVPDPQLTVTQIRAGERMNMLPDRLILCTQVYRLAASRFLGAAGRGVPQGS